MACGRPKARLKAVETGPPAPDPKCEPEVPKSKAQNPNINRADALGILGGLRVLMTGSE
jgi:hypothetical protein